MNKKELRAEIDETTRIFRSAKYYFTDFKYVHSIKFKMPIVYQTFYFFIERVFHSICVSLILDLCKLFDKREKFSLEKLCNKILLSYSKSELNNFLLENEFNKLHKTLDPEKISFLLHKLKTTRDEYYAHFDRTRTNFESIQMSSSEFDELISIAEIFIKTIELKYFGISVDFESNKGELGHAVFERLNDWEEYREKYGTLKINR